jgi:hypothetical protein
MENNELEITKEQYESLLAEKESLKTALEIERKEKKELKGKLTETPATPPPVTTPPPANTEQPPIEDIVSKALEAERRQIAFKQDLEAMVEEPLRQDVLDTMNKMFKEIPETPEERKTLMKIARDYLVSSKSNGSTITNAVAGADSSRGNKNLSPEREENPYIDEKQKKFHEQILAQAARYKN